MNKEIEITNKQWEVCQSALDEFFPKPKNEKGYKNKLKEFYRQQAIMFASNLWRIINVKEQK